MTPLSADSVPAREGFRAALVLALLWGALGFAGYPQPNVDDGFFGGAGIHLATTGSLTNPWIAGWIGYLPGVDPMKYLVQPPLHPAVMALWLHAFGISTASITAFACTLNFGAGLAVWFVFRRLSRQAFAAWLAVAVVSGWLLFRGLRPESLAVLFLAGGQYLLLRQRTVAAWLVGALLCSGAVIAHASSVLVVVPATLLQLADPSLPRGARPRLLAALGAGILAAFAALVAGLGADFPPFLHALAAHAHFVAPSGQRLAVFAGHLRVGFEFYINLLVLAGLLAALAAALRLPAARPAALRGAAGWGLLLLLGLALYAAQSAMYAVLAAALVPLALAGRATGAARALACAGAATLVAWHGLQHSLQALANRQHDATAQRAEVAAYVASVRPEVVFFDATTLRTVFDYRPPAGAVDAGWSWAPGRADRWWSPRHLAPRDLWVINPAWSHRHLAGEAAKLRFVLAGRAFPSVHTTRGLLLIPGSALPAPHGLPFLRSPLP